jgi:hypothetical protein
MLLMNPPYLSLVARLDITLLTSGANESMIPIRTNLMPCRLVIPATAASTNARTVHTVVAEASDVSGIHSLRDTLKFVVEVNSHQFGTM